MGTHPPAPASRRLPEMLTPEEIASLRAEAVQDLEWMRERDRREALEREAGRAPPAEGGAGKPHAREVDPLADPTRRPR